MNAVVLAPTERATTPIGGAALLTTASEIAAAILRAAMHESRTPLKIYLDLSKPNGHIRFTLMLSWWAYDGYVRLCQSACNNVRPFTDDLPLGTYFPSVLNDGQQCRTQAALGQCGVATCDQAGIMSMGEPWHFSAICLPEDWQDPAVFAKLQQIVVESDEPAYFDGAPEKWRLYPFHGS